jgi:hypothetical protein
MGDQGEDKKQDVQIIEVFPDDINKTQFLLQPGKEIRVLVIDAGYKISEDRG